MAVKVRQGGGRDVGAAQDTPSERIVAAANKIEFVTTADGRRLGLRKLGAFDEMRISRAVGRDAANEQYYLWCMLAASVAQIDDDVLPIPETQLEFEFVIQRIGDAGVAAIQRHAESKFAAERASQRRTPKNKGGEASPESEFADAVKK